MKIALSIEGLDNVQRELRRISSAIGQGRATAAAINKVAEKAQVEIRRAVTERYQITADQVRGSMYLRRASAKRATVEAVVDIFGSPTKSGRSMNMVRFLAAVQAAGRAMKTRGSRAKKKQLEALGKQIGFAIKRGGGMKTIPGAFVGNHGRTVFRRIGRARLPIEPIQVIGVSQMFSSREIHSRILAKISADLEIEMRRAVEMILAKT